MPASGVRSTECAELPVFSLGFNFFGLFALMIGVFVEAYAVDRCGVMDNVARWVCGGDLASLGVLPFSGDIGL